MKNWLMLAVWCACGIAGADEQAGHGEHMSSMSESAGEAEAHEH